MRDPLPTGRAAGQPAGLIDTIQAGFSTVNRNAWLLALPLAIDLVIWLGPQLTLGTVVAQWLAEAAAPPATNILRSAEEGGREWLGLVGPTDALSRYNLVSFLAVPLLGVPSFRAGAPGQGAAMPLDSAPIAAGALLSILATGLASAAMFYGMLGQAVRDGRAAPRYFLAGFGQIVVWFFGLFVLVLAVFLGVIVPIGLLLILSSASAPLVSSLLGPVVLGVAFWSVLYLFFTPDALFVSRVPPSLAIQYSIRVVRHNFWSTLGFIGLVLVISVGLAILWNEVATALHTPGVALATLGHIYISSGLAAASMTYYKERFDRLRLAI